MLSAWALLRQFGPNSVLVPLGADELGETPAYIMQWLLMQLGVASDPRTEPVDPWPAYFDSEPPKPDNVVTTYDTTPAPDGRSMPTGEVFQHYGIQIRIRSSRGNDGWVKGQQIETALATQVRNTAITFDNGRRYIIGAISRMNVLRVGHDAPNSSRRMFTINCLMTLRRTN